MAKPLAPSHFVTSMLRHIATCSLLLIYVTSTGCKLQTAAQKPPPQPPTTNVPASDVQHDDLILLIKQVTATNNRNKHLTSAWANLNITALSIGDDGEQNVESARGHFIYQKPSNIAISGYKLDDLVGWYGSNDQLRWWHIAEENKIWVIRTDNIPSLTRGYDTLASMAQYFTLHSLAIVPEIDIARVNIVSLNQIAIDIIDPPSGLSKYGISYYEYSGNIRWDIFFDSSSDMPSFVITSALLDGSESHTTLFQTYLEEYVPIVRSNNNSKPQILAPKSISTYFTKTPENNSTAKVGIIVEAAEPRESSPINDEIHPSLFNFHQWRKPYGNCEIIVLDKDSTRPSLIPPY